MTSVALAKTAESNSYVFFYIGHYGQGIWGFASTDQQIKPTLLD